LKRPQSANHRFRTRSISGRDNSLTYSPLALFVQSTPVDSISTTNHSDKKTDPLLETVAPYSFSGTDQFFLGEPLCVSRHAAWDCGVQYQGCMQAAACLQERFSFGEPMSPHCPCLECHGISLPPLPYEGFHINGTPATGIRAVSGHPAHWLVLRRGRFGIHGW